MSQSDTTATETIPIDDIEFVKDLYPRIEVDDRRVRDYQNALAELPPIEVSQDHKLIDGYHRLRAHRQAGADEIEAEVVRVENDDELFVRAVEANVDHGIQLTRAEKAAVARQWRADGWDATAISDVLSVSDGWVSSQTKDIAADLRDERRDKAVAYYLDYLSYPTKQAVADELGVSRPTAKADVDGFKSEETYDAIADWLKVDNVWTFQQPAPEFGADGWPGRIPGQIVVNFLYYWTDAHDLVCDPMAGGGTTVDVCEWMHRRYAAFDINPLEDRNIRKADALDGLPELDAGVVDAVFFDPPYWRLKDDDYVEGSVSAGTYDEWVDAMATAFDTFERVCKSGATVGMLIQSIHDRDTETFHDAPYDMAAEALARGWTALERATAPMTHGMMNHRPIEQAKENEWMINLNRDFLVWELP